MKQKTVFPSVLKMKQYRFLVYITICAERNAIFRAVFEGHQDILEIAIYVDSDLAFPPCGACRQVMAEFNPKMKVIFANRNETIISDLGALLPGHFSLEKV